MYLAASSQAITFGVWQTCHRHTQDVPSDLQPVGGLLALALVVHDTALDVSRCDF